MFSGERVIGRKFAFQNGLSLTEKPALNRLNLYTANSPWAYIREDFLSRGEQFL